MREVFFEAFVIVLVALSYFGFGTLFYWLGYYKGRMTEMRAKDECRNTD